MSRTGEWGEGVGSPRGARAGAGENDARGRRTVSDRYGATVRPTTEDETKEGRRVASRRVATSELPVLASRRFLIVVVSIIHMRLLSRPKTALLPQSHSTSHLFLHEICSEKYAPYHRSMVLIPDHTTSPGRSAAACPPPSCAN